MAQKKKPSRIGVMDDAAYRKIALRNREKKALARG